MARASPVPPSGLLGREIYFKQALGLWQSAASEGPSRVGACISSRPHGIRGRAYGRIVGPGYPSAAEPARGRKDRPRCTGTDARLVAGHHAPTGRARQRGGPIPLDRATSCAHSHDCSSGAPVNPEASQLQLYRLGRGLQPIEGSQSIPGSTPNESPVSMSIGDAGSRWPLHATGGRGPGPPSDTVIAPG